ncbi:hypothetical protein [Nocardia lijiangensis]|uniref:hypothetical protein n=1 Tax=Nocardia lijiangensis TaxID=299618 RepID=UPI000833D27E|nr:hypothetical protein [Nocardia lijiangensis]
MGSQWKFADPRNTAAFTTRDIAFGNDWVAYVFHDADNGGWQFHDSDPAPPTADDDAMIGLEEMVDRDPSMESLADLPPGW